MILLTTVYMQTGYIHYVIHVQFIFAPIECYQMIDSEKKYIRCSSEPVSVGSYHTVRMYHY